MKKIICVIASLVIIMSTFTGCAPELYQRLIVKGIAIDMSGDEYKITVRVMDFKEKGEKIMTTKGKTVYDALMGLGLESGKKAMYSHSYYIIFGKSTVDKGIEKSIDFFVRYFHSQPTINVFIAAGNAGDLLNVKMDNKLIPSEDIGDLGKSQEMSGMAVTADMLRLVSYSMDMGKTALVPIIRTDGKKLYLKDTAMLKNYKFMGLLDSDETMGYLAATSDLKSGTIVSDTIDFGKITASVMSTKTKITFGENENEINVETMADCILASASFGKGIGSGEFKKLEDEIGERLKKKISAALTTGYSKSCDIVSLGHKKYIEQTDVWRESKGNWDSMLPGLKFNVKVTVLLNKTGEENRPPKF